MKLPKVPIYFSTQAQVAMLGYVVLAVAIMLPVNIEKEEYNLTERIVSLLMMVLPMVVSVYTINCLVKGSSKGGVPCDVLAWLNSGSILVWSVLVLVLTLLIYANNDVEEFWPFGRDKKRRGKKPRGQRRLTRPLSESNNNTQVLPSEPNNNTQVLPGPVLLKPPPSRSPPSRSIIHKHEGHPLHKHKKPHIVNKPLPRPMLKR
tara:strand:- start:91 stop:702 length:612 start_codon:yes stop_codon:yes gene_type:complete